MPRSNRTERKWPSIALAIGYALTAVLHFISALVKVLVFGGKGSFSSHPAILPVYGRLGAFGYTVFFLTIPLDVVAFIYFLRRSAWGQVATIVAAILNLPLIPFGTITGAGTLVWLWSPRRTP